MKAIIIDKCANCPHYSTGSEYSDPQCTRHGQGWSLDRPWAIQDYCPLMDIGEYEGDKISEKDAGEWLEKERERINGFK